MKNETKIKCIGLEMNHIKEALQLLEGILSICKKWDGKKINMRLDTQLKTLNQNLSFSTQYNSFKICFYNPQRFITTENGHTEYLKNDSLYLVHTSLESSYKDGICQNGLFRFEILEKVISRDKEYYIKQLQEVEDNLKNIETLIKERDELKNTIDVFNNKITHTIENYFSLRF